MDLAARRELNNGFGDTLARSFEFALTPMIFAAGGFALDRVFGTSVAFTIGLLLFGILGVSIRWYYDYALKLDAIDRARAEKRSSTTLAAPVVTKVVEVDGGLPTGITLDAPSSGAEA